MRLTPKTKGIIVIIIFVAILVLPASYGLIRAFFGKHSEAPRQDSIITGQKK